MQNGLGGIRTFEATVTISGVLDVPMSDWPPNIMDRIEETVERLAAKVELPLAIVHGEYKTDPDVPIDMPGHHYLHIVVSEVVIADERTLSPGRVVANTSKRVS